MNTKKLIEDTIKHHPQIDFTDQTGANESHWICCPCGFTTGHFPTNLKAYRDFEGHIAEEVHAMLVAQLNPNLARVFEEYSVITPRTIGLPISPRMAFA